jgi:hypothetical protein
VRTSPRIDLPEMENLFRIFCGAKGATKAILEKQSGRCKIQAIERFRESTHWVIDRWRNRGERLEIGADESSDRAEKQEVDALVSQFNAALAAHGKFISDAALEEHPSAEVAMGDSNRFNLFIGPRRLVKNIAGTADKIPAYSANVVEPMGFVAKSNIADFTHPSVIWGIDGNFEFSLIQPGVEFATTDHCGTIQILDPHIVPEYLLYALNVRKIEESFDRSFRPSLTNMRLFTVTIPVRPDKTFDVTAQKEIARRFTGERERREKLSAIKCQLDEIFGRYLQHSHI